MNFHFNQLISFFHIQSFVIKDVINIALLYHLCSQALSASGLRALRYAREVEGIGQVVALDNDKGKFQAVSIYCINSCL